MVTHAPSRRLAWSGIWLLLGLLALSALPAQAQTKRGTKKRPAPSQVAPATGRQETEARLKDLRAQISRTRSRLKSTESAARSTLTTLRELDRQSALVTALVATLRTEAEHLQREIRVRERRVDSARSELERLQQQYARYAVGVYTRGRQTDVEQILTAGSLNQSLVRAEYLRRFTEERREKRSEIEAQQAQIEAEQEALTARLGDQKAVLAERRREEQSLRAQRQSRQATLQSAQQDAARYQTELDAQQAQATGLQQAIQNLIAREEAERARRREAARQAELAREAERTRQRQLAAEQARLDAARQAERDRAAAARPPAADPQQPTPANPPAPSGGTAAMPPDLATAAPPRTAVPRVEPPPEPPPKPAPELADLPTDYEATTAASFTGRRGRLPWPVSSGVIVNRFGMNTDATLGTTHPNNGIDLSVRDRSPVRAVSSGEVLMVTFIAGYRSVVIVSHGDGFKTVYANLDEVIVHEGARLNAGDLLGRADDDLHFEVWRGRAAQNPEQWLAPKR